MAPLSCRGAGQACLLQSLARPAAAETRLWLLGGPGPPLRKGAPAHGTPGWLWGSPLPAGSPARPRAGYEAASGKRPPRLPHPTPARPRPPRSSSAAEASASRGPATPEDGRLHLATHVSCVFRASASPGGREGRALRGRERGRAGHGGGRWAPLRHGFASVTGRERRQGLPGPCSPFRRARTRDTAAERGGLGPGCSPGSGAPGRARGCRPAPPTAARLLPPPSSRRRCVDPASCLPSAGSGCHGGGRGGDRLAGQGFGGRRCVSPGGVRAGNPDQPRLRVPLPGGCEGGSVTRPGRWGGPGRRCRRCAGEMADGGAERAAGWKPPAESARVLVPAAVPGGEGWACLPDRPVSWGSGCRPLQVSPAQGGCARSHLAGVSCCLPGGGGQESPVSTATAREGPPSSQPGDGTRCL